MGMMLNCVAVDDEPPALVLLNKFITETPSLRLCASFSNGVDALRYIECNPVDLVFLDIQMPDLSGIELAQLLSDQPEDKRPAVIFITAHSQFALEGFKLDVTDYILKPFSYQHFLKATNKAFKWFELSAKASQYYEKDEEHIYLRVNRQTTRINCADISYIEGLKDYARIRLVNGEKSLLSLITLKALEETLPPGKFIRIHRSFIVAFDKITAVTKSTVSIGEITLPVSLPFRADVERFSKNWR
jgi:two-component system response regulator LytT